MKSVMITSPEGYGTGTKVFDSESGLEIKDIVKITIAPIVPNSPNSATIELFGASMSVSVQATFVVMHNGELKAVKRIEFEDGAAVEF